MDNTLIATLVGAIGPSGALVWFLYHTTTKTFPELTKKADERLEKMIADFRADLAAEREHRESQVQIIAQLCDQLNRLDPRPCPLHNKPEVIFHRQDTRIGRGADGTAADPEPTAKRPSATPR